jgi:hypothetical protein
VGITTNDRIGYPHDVRLDTHGEDLQYDDRGVVHHVWEKTSAIFGKFFI